MRFPPQLLDEIRARLPVSQVVGKRVKLKRAGREFVGLSPFKQEKTPSFTVNDQKGFYHCFATGEHGDIFTFLMKTEGLSFPESVERLAGEAGVPLPKSTPEAAERAELNDRLRHITALSADFFAACLKGAEGKFARDYLINRGLGQQEAARFNLGYAPNSRDALKQHLLQKGCDMNDMILSGMIIGGKDIDTPYDRFRHRLIFPITDLKEQPIAFGGRALDPDQPAKYLNSPETPLFHKGFQLYNAAPARKAAYEKKAIMVTEGYMDVIAMHQAGFDNTVAPLGTALTADQLALLWRMAEEPILCFDGDAAGRKAADRAVETALPGLKPGLSLRFAFLPDGEDPDDYLKARGSGPMKTLLEHAAPLVDQLWQKEFAKEQWTTPERRAALERNLFELVGTITDPIVKTHYQRDIKSRLWRAFQQSGKNKVNNQYNRQHRNARQQGGGRTASMREARAPASTALMNSPLLLKSNQTKSGQEAAILTLVLNHPWILETEDETFAALTFKSPAAEKLRKAVLEALFTLNPLDQTTLEAHLKQGGLSEILEEMQSSVSINGPAYAGRAATPDAVQKGWQELLLRHHKTRELKEELKAAETAYLNEANEVNFDRLRTVQQALEQASHQHIEADDGP